MSSGEDVGEILTCSFLFTLSQRITSYGQDPPFMRQVEQTGLMNYLFVIWRHWDVRALEACLRPCRAVALERQWGCAISVPVLSFHYVARVSFLPSVSPSLFIKSERYQMKGKKEHRNDKNRSQFNIVLIWHDKAKSIFLLCQLLKGTNAMAPLKQ